MHKEFFRKINTKLWMVGAFGCLMVGAASLFVVHNTGKAAAAESEMPILAKNIPGSPTGSLATAYPPPEITVDNVTVSEGSGGILQAIFSIIRSGYLGNASSLDYSTSDGTASQPGDYTSQSGTLNFASQESNLTVEIDVHGDTLDEADENFFLDLDNPFNADIIDDQGQADILDDDAPPALSIDDISINEGDSGAVTASFTVSLSAASGKTVTVDFASTDGTAAHPVEYSAAATGSLTFLPGDTVENIDVLVMGDILDEFNETFFIDLSNPVNASLADVQGQATITDDDPLPDLSVADVTVTDGFSSNVLASFSVSLDAPSGKTVTVNFTTQDGTASSPQDYTTASGLLTFSPGQTQKSLDITVIGSLLPESHEQFFMNLSGVSNANLVDDQAIGNILKYSLTLPIIYKN